MLNLRDCDGTLSLDRAHESIVIAKAAAQIAISILFRNIAYTDKLELYVLHGPVTGFAMSFTVPGISVWRLRLDLSNRCHVAPAVAPKVDEARKIGGPQRDGYRNNCY